MTATMWSEAPVAIEGNGVEPRAQEAGGHMSAAFVRLPQGVKVAPVLVGLPDDLCQGPTGVTRSNGRLGMRTKAGDEICEAGQVFHRGPGHVPEAVEECANVGFSPSKEFNVVIDHIKSQTG